MDQEAWTAALGAVQASKLHESEVRWDTAIHSPKLKPTDTQYLGGKNDSETLHVYLIYLKLKFHSKSDKR